MVQWISSVQSSHSVVSDSLRPHDCSTPGFPVHHQLPEPIQIHVHRVGDCHLTILPSVMPFSLPQPFPVSGSFPMSQFFTSDGQSIGVSASAVFSSIQFQLPSSEYSGLISFRMDWLDLLAVQGALKSLLQHHSSKASILWHLDYFIAHLSHPYMTTGKTIALTRQTIAGKVMSLFFNMLSRLVIAFLPRNKYLLISWLQSPSAVI